MYQVKQKKKNNEEFLTFLYKNPSFTISQAGKILGLTYPTTKRIVDDFLEEELLIQNNNISNTVGRSSASFSLNKEKFYSVGVQIELKKISFILIDIFGNVIKENSVLNVEYTNDNFGKIIHGLFFDFYSSIEEKVRDKILGVGISFPGIVDDKEEKILNAVNLNLKDFPLGEIFQEFHENIYLENDANACIYSEKIIGKGKNFKNFVVISIGSGIGAGVYINSRLHKGEHHLSGEFGHISIDYLGKQCKCGNKGCWELYVSENAISDYQEKMQDRNLENLFDSNKNRDFIDEYIKIFSIGLKNILFAVDVNNIIISGNMSKYLSDYKDEISYNIKSNSFFKEYQLELLFSDLNNRSSVLGAALIPVSNYFNLVFTDN